jgi:hypothetical protein
MTHYDMGGQLDSPTAPVASGCATLTGQMPNLGLQGLR